MRFLLTFVFFLSLCSSTALSDSKPDSVETTSETPSDKVACQFGDVMKGCSMQDIQNAYTQVYSRHSPTAIYGGVYPSATSYQRTYSIHGSCSLELKPKAAVIEGVLVESGDSASSAKKKLDTQGSLLKKIARSLGGKVEFLEIMRYRGSVNPSAPRYGAAPVESKFIARQRIQVVLVPSADIDSALDEVFELGVEAYDPRWQPRAHYSSTTAQPLVVYQFADPKELLNQEEDRCGGEAFARWCKSQFEDDIKDFCKKDFKEIKHEFSQRTLSLTSQHVPQRNGNNYGITLSMTNGAPQLQYVKLNEVLSSSPLQFHGSFSGSFLVGKDE